MNFKIIQSDLSYDFKKTPFKDDAKQFNNKNIKYI